MGSLCWGMSGGSSLSELSRDTIFVRFNWGRGGKKKFKKKKKEKREIIEAQRDGGEVSALQQILDLACQL